MNLKNQPSGKIINDQTAWIKICGIQSLNPALLAEQLGANALGFIFAPSKRRVSSELAQSICSKIKKKKTEKIGVFVNASPSYVFSVAQQVGLDAVQLHGKESPADFKDFPLPIIKAIGVEHEQDLHEIDPFWLKNHRVLLDTKKNGLFGGTGASFDWRFLRSPPHSSSFYIAGGINSENICSALRIPGVLGVDLSSGVEENGQKSEKKIRDIFIKLSHFNKK